MTLAFPRGWGTLSRVGGIFSGCGCSEVRKRKMSHKTEKVVCEVTSVMSDSLQPYSPPCTLAHQATLSMGFCRQEYWSGLPCPPPGDLPNPGMEPVSLTSALAGRFFTTSTIWEGSSVQFSHCRVRLFAAPWTAAHQASLSITNSQSLFKLMSMESVMSSNHLILCRPLLLLPSIFPSIRVFSNESVLPTRWPKYWSFSFSISPSNVYSGLTSFSMEWLDLLAVRGTLKSLLQHHTSTADFNLNEWL